MDVTILSNIQLLVMDVDGTLTDGTLTYGPHGELSKNFFVRDGMGIVLLHTHSIKTAIITAETTPIVQARANRLGITIVRLGVKNKKEELSSLSTLLDIPLKNIAYIGDDINDIRALEIAGYSCCPSDAHPLVKQICHKILPYPGGKGAVRQLCDEILQAKNLPLNPEDPWL